MSLIRSFLFAPADNERRAAKALAVGADAAILDIEDAVAPGGKGMARAIIREHLGRRRAARLYVRINDVRGELCYEDLHEVVWPGLDGLVVPKVESAEELRIVDWLVTRLEKRRGMQPGAVDLIGMVETATGLHCASEIASSCRRLSRLAFGALDFSLDVGSEGPEALLYARSQLALASRAGGILPPVDSVFPAIRDEEGLLREARHAKGLGFFGKLLIHPDQVGPVNRLFTPDPEEVAHARRVVEAFVEAEAGGSAVIQLDGSMIDLPVVERARRTLALAEDIMSRGKGMHGETPGEPG